MLPLGLLTAAQGHPMLVELKNGETLNGHLVNCDTWMNLTLKEVVQTSPEGDRFWRLPECYVRGNNVRLDLPSNISEFQKKSSNSRENNSSNNSNNISRVVDSVVVGVGKLVTVPVEGEEAIVDEGAVDREGVAEEGTVVGEGEEEGRVEVNSLFGVLYCACLYGICIVTITPPMLKDTESSTHINSTSHFYIKIRTSSNSDLSRHSANQCPIGQREDRTSFIWPAIDMQTQSHHNLPSKMETSMQKF
ncbi:hypothetical protein AYO20_01557 [Fonsecaea nubica]|uniref:LSM complex subunit LSM4 n=1 Tax=Fonsecaea nubica TaxID=856822 RepID=A0A178DAP5_9EURO|nr:hypothetical protein AYO20_01557 [Fonsecaea nubica]OAL39239.1 hypothetical protein AYO20_01557 [Fonsecaea nubica]